MKIVNSLKFKGDKMTRSEIYASLGCFKRVENMISDNGNFIPNQFILYYDNGKVFQSYSSIIAITLNHSSVVYLGENWDYSRTTNKYRNKFLNECKKETETKIKNGKYIIVGDI